jgi:hypothetical protein
MKTLIVLAAPFAFVILAAALLLAAYGGDDPMSVPPAVSYMQQ